jgi:enamine deaminase RidA (YjgF/YER057c/UK114 family)
MASSKDVPFIERVLVERLTIGSGYAFEDSYGYSRAVRVGDQVFVSGTTARLPALDGDAYAQARPFWR